MIEPPHTRIAGSVVRRPDGRLSMLAVVMTLPLLGVFVRLCELQTHAASLVGETTTPVRTVLQPIPARDGRILSADGRVLAEDIEAFEVFVHYRWFERPANPRWLRGEALRQLDRSERRDPALVTHAEQDVLKRREALWHSLCRLTGLSQEALFSRFAEIQERVSAIHRAVEKSRSDNLARRASTIEDGPPIRTWWEYAWREAERAVTTPPRPSESEPLVLMEELDPHAIVSGQPLGVAAAIEADPAAFPGTSVRVASRRRYPLGATAAHVVGYRFPDDDSNLVNATVDETNGETPSEIAGQTGVERSYDRHLRGVDGVRKVWLDRRGEEVRSTVVREPRVGRDLVLHLDLGLQLEVEGRLDESLATIENDEGSRDGDDEPSRSIRRGGAVVAIDVRTGAILAAASAPRFDLGQAAGRSSSFWKTVLDDPGRPLFDRVCSAEVPPGSVFKPVTAVAMLESGKVDPDDPFDCRGYLDRKDRLRDYIFRRFGVGHGPTTLTKALAESCNVYFFHGARTIGASHLVNWADTFGFGRPTGVDLPCEATGNLEHDPRNADVLGLSIGQAELTATPLQIVTMTAAIANGGRLVTPHVVRGSGPAREGTASVRPIVQTSVIEDLRPDTLARVREGLAQVVAHPQGTGFKLVKHPHIAIAGKTGTAEVGGGLPDHAWFAGYAPADDPQVAFVVFVAHGGSGGETAGPLARQLVDALLHHGLVRP